jgi:hypothetical protein
MACTWLGRMMRQFSWDGTTCESRQVVCLPLPFLKYRGFPSFSSRTPYNLTFFVICPLVSCARLLAATAATFIRVCHAPPSIAA